MRYVVGVVVVRKGPWGGLAMSSLYAFCGSRLFSPSPCGGEETFIELLVQDHHLPVRT
jgi:hypothetical protein